MIDVSISTGDIVVDAFGDIRLCASDNEDIVQSINSLLQTRLGSNEFHTEYGNDARNNRLKDSTAGIEAIKMYCTNAILNNIDYISFIKDISITVGDDYSYTVDYIVTLDNGDILNGRAII